MAEARVLNYERKADWNRFVDNNDSASPYHRYEWLQATETAYGHKALPLVVIHENEIVAALPLVLMKHPLFSGRSLVSLPFCDVGGVLGNPGYNPLLREKALEVARDHRASLLEIRERATDGLGFDFDQLGETWAGYKVSMLMPLATDSDAQLASFKPKLRSQIKKAAKNGCTTQLGNSPGLIRDFYHVFSRNMRQLGSPVHSEEFFHAICTAYGDNAIIGVTYLDGQPTAAGIILKNGRQASIPWASSLAEYNRLAPNMSLYWTLIAHCADTGIGQFDFGRSSFGEGTFRFKKQWGAEPHLLTWQNWLDEGNTRRPGQGRLRTLAEQVWSRLPLGLVNFLGPFVRKHIRL